MYVPRVLFMSLEDSLCPQSRVYVLTAQFIYLLYNVCPQCTFYDTKVTVYVPSVQFILPQYSYVPMVLLMYQE